jgi:hypothetical protein
MSFPPDRHPGVQIRADNKTLPHWLGQQRKG